MTYCRSGRTSRRGARRDRHGLAACAVLAAGLMLPAAHASLFPLPADGSAVIGVDSSVSS